MVAPVTVSEKDLRTLLGIVACERGDLPPHGLPPSLLSDLLSLIRCDGVNFFGMDTGQQTFWFDQQVPPDNDDVGVDVQVFWENYRGSDFCTYCARSGDLRSVTKLSDFYSARRWHSTALYSDYFRLWGTERALLMVLPAGHTNAQIARRLGVSDGTVRIHLQNIYARLQVPSRTAAVTRAFPDLAAG